MNAINLTPITPATNNRLSAVEHMQAETDRMAQFQKEVLKHILLLSGTEIGTVRPEWRWWSNTSPVLKIDLVYLSKEVEIVFGENNITITDISSDEELEYVVVRKANNGSFAFDAERSDYVDGNTPNAILQLLDELEKMAVELFQGEHFVLPVEIRSDDAVIGTNGPEIWFESDGTTVIAENTLTGINWYDTSFVPSEMISALKKFIEG